MNVGRRFEPGELTTEYCRRKGWSLFRRNVMVEGNSDVRYFELASKLYLAANSRSLLGVDFGCFASGTGDNGGVDGVIREYAALRQIVDSDRDANLSTLFRVVALLDDDPAGRACAKSLSTAWRYRHGRDFFLMRRTWPMSTNEPGVLCKQLEQDRFPLFTEIEDLVSAPFLDSFADERSDAFRRAMQHESGARYSNFNEQMKGALWIYVKENAILADLIQIVECLRAIRFYIGLPPDGIPRGKSR